MTEKEHRAKSSLWATRPQRSGSIFDGLGFPQEHMEFAYSNGSDALALTDHGNMNGLSYQVLTRKEDEGRRQGLQAYLWLRGLLPPFN